LPAGLDHRPDVLGAFNKHDAVGKLGRKIGGGVGVLLAEGLAGLQAFAERLLEDTQDPGDPLFVPDPRPNILQRHQTLPPCVKHHWVRGRPPVCPERQGLQRFAATMMPGRTRIWRRTESALGDPGFSVSARTRRVPRMELVRRHATCPRGIRSPSHLGQYQTSHDVETGWEGAAYLFSPAGGEKVAAAG